MTTFIEWKEKLTLPLSMEHLSAMLNVAYTQGQSDQLKEIIDEEKTAKMAQVAV